MIDKVMSLLEKKDDFPYLDEAFFAKPTVKPNPNPEEPPLTEEALLTEAKKKKADAPKKEAAPKEAPKKDAAPKSDKKDTPKEDKPTKKDDKFGGGKGADKKEDDPFGASPPDDLSKSPEGKEGEGGEAEGATEPDVFQSFSTVQNTVRSVNKHLTMLDLLMRSWFDPKLFKFSKRMTEFHELLQTIIENWSHLKDQGKILTLIKQCSDQLHQEFKVTLEHIKQARAEEEATKTKRHEAAEDKKKANMPADGLDKLL